MLLNTLEHLAARLATVAGVIHAGEKTNLLNSLMTGSNSEITIALKMSALISGSEYLSDQILGMVTNIKVPNLYGNVQTLGITFVTNALVLLAMDKLNIDNLIVTKTASYEKKALQLGVLFILVQEISTRVIEAYLSRR